jgi:transcription antitermination factor NusG
VCINPFKKAWLQVLKVPGIVGFISNQSGPLPIPDRQIEDIRTVLKAKARYWLQPLLQVGGRVRVVRGSLSGVQGTLVRNNLESRLLISIETVSQTLAVNVSVGDVEPLSAEFSLPNRIQSSNTQCSYVL